MRREISVAEYSVDRELLREASALTMTYPDFFDQALYGQSERPDVVTNISCNGLVPGNCTEY